jgi:hypothetical protein
MTRKTLENYGMQKIAVVRLLPHNQFVIELIDAGVAAWECSIYAFLIGPEICRIGSSKAPLGGRFRQWQHDVSARLANPDPERRMRTPLPEAEGWKHRLERYGKGFVFARLGTIVNTPIGEFPAYLDEESVLIGRHLPALNGSKHR